LFRREATDARQMDALEVSMISEMPTPSSLVKAGAFIECRVCGSSDCHESFSSYRGSVYHCKQCRLYFVGMSEAPPLGQESGFYSTIDEERYKEYFRPFRSDQYRYVLSQLPSRRGASLLDIGASYGWMVEVGNNLGFDSFGLEPGSASYDASLEGRIFRETLENFCARSKRKFDVITIWHVLEHLPDPVAAMGQINSLLEDGGTLVIAVPTSDGWMFRLALLLNKLFGSKHLLNELFYFHNINMHFTYPNIESVDTLLQQQKLKIISAITLEAFDWKTIWKRATSPYIRIGLKLLGPLIATSGFTRRENLVVIAQKPIDKKR
jgi:2-polyprenyl-3-methyl-5-hydroxy-6-metoxy-1,4-benzoquinol methylase